MDDDDQKHACKFCYKTFPCGRSLGGHMRSHMITTISSSHLKKKLPPPSPRPNAFVEDVGTKKLCKECGKTFQSWKALFGHMKSHSVTKKGSNNGEEEGSWNESDDVPPLCRGKRSNRAKRYTNSITPNSSSLTISSSQIVDQHDQEEVALSLILLSMDVESHGEWLEFKKVKREKVEPIPDGETESEVTSPKTLINHIDQLRSDHSDKKSKFRCVICRKGFCSYQALGGHRASHKKFKGCCSPTTHQIQDQDQEKIILEKKKDHECPICFKDFPSGQALGGHKRSHLISDHPSSRSKTNHPLNIGREQTSQETRGFLDLNLPAPAEEEECSEFKPWWMDKHHHRGQILRFLSTS